MRPLTVITAIVLGSSVSITVSLAAVLLMFLVLGDDYPRLAWEFRGVVVSFALFLGMTVVAAVSFWTLVRQHAARHAAQAAMWLAVAGVGYFYWP